MPPALLLAVSLLMQLSRTDLIEVDADDTETGQAIVRSAQQQFPGGVRLVSRSGAKPTLGTIILKVRRKGPARLHLELSMGSTLRVQQELNLDGRPERFDVGEAVALALVDLRERLLEQRTRAPLPRTSAVARPAPPAAVQPPVPHEVATPEAQAPQAPPPPAVALPPVIPPSVQLPPPPPRFQPAPSWWKLTLAVPLAAAGLAAVAIGATSVAVDGRCVDEACESRFAGRTAGSIEIGLGAAATLAGGSLLAYELYRRRHRGEPRTGADARRVSLIPAISAQPGFVLLGRF